MTKAAFSVALIAIVLPCIGCMQSSGPALGKVSGTVTLDGQPVQNAGLEFIGDAGGVAYGRTDASGRYYMSFGSSRTGALVGKNLVRITSSDKVTVGDKQYESKEVFPKKYNVNSDQYVEVAKGSNTIDFACVSGGAAPAAVAASRGGN